MSDNSFAAPLSPDSPKLLDRVRAHLRFKHYSMRTETAYTGWIKRYIHFHGKRHPGEMGKCEVEAFLTSLALERNVSAATQNQALSALLLLYREILEIELPWRDDVTRAKKPARLPTVLTSEETAAPLAFGWQYVFAASGFSVDPHTNAVRRHHVDEKRLQRAVKRAVEQAGIVKTVSPHTLDILLPLTFWRPVTTSARCRSYWGARMFQQR